MLQIWKHHEVYEEVPNQVQRFFSTTWVATETYKEGIKVKAHLEAWGFKEGDLDRLRKDLPTCGKESIKLLFVILASNG